MDEATSCIDLKTENLIQKAISELLYDSTIITIAHRIKTIIKSDKILVLEQGRVAEYDTPSNLMNKKDSLFYELYSKSH
jgi:ABC-type multidrug transport system fused ATPase/permease subunit